VTKQSKRNVSAICAISLLFVSIAPTGAVWADDSSGLPNVPQIQLEDPNARPFTLAPNPDPSLSGAEREQLELQDPSRVISELVSGGVLIPFKPQMEKDENGDSEMVVIGTDEQQQPKKVKWNRNLGWATLVVATTEVAAVTLMTQLPNTVTGWTGRNPKLWHLRKASPKALGSTTTIGIGTTWRTLGKVPNFIWLPAIVAPISGSRRFFRSG
jgi:hypothetical protein